MSDTNFSLSVNFKVATCGCGTIYAIPVWVVSYCCPMCSAREWVERNARIEEYERIIRSLRGAITRLKKAQAKR